MKLRVELSTVSDGSMSGGDVVAARQSRRQFLTAKGMSPEQAVLVWLKYEGNDYCRYRTVDMALAGEGMTYPAREVSDAVFTDVSGLTLFLPLADCIGAVLYDRNRYILGLSHLGRHNLEQLGGRRSVEYMTKQFGTDPQDVEVWLSPAAGGDNYPLYAFDGRSLQEVAVEQLMEAGVSRAAITTDGMDTTTHESLFSHSEYLKGRQDSDGRHAVAAMLEA